MPKPALKAVHTREQLPYGFQAYGNWIATVISATLLTGEYSVQGWEKSVAFGRRSLAELVLNLTTQQAFDILKIYQRAVQ